MKSILFALLVSTSLVHSALLDDGLVLHYSPSSIESTPESHVKLWVNQVSGDGYLTPTHSTPVIRRGDLPAIGNAPFDVTEWLNDNLAAEPVAALDGSSLQGLTYTLLLRVNEWPQAAFVMMRNVYLETPGKRRPLDLGFNANGEVFLSGGTAAGAYAAGPAELLETGRWYVVTATWLPTGELTLFVDGEEVGMTSGAALSLTDRVHERLLIETSPQPTFQADIAEILVYNRALTPEEVRSNVDAFSQIYSLSGKPEPRAETKPAGAASETSVAVTDGGLWPTLVQASEGLFLFVFNAPGHATVPGDIACYFSGDSGRSWSLRGEVGHRQNDGTTQWGQASGVTPDGNLITLTREKTDITDPGTSLPAKVLHSQDGGRTWTQTSSLPSANEGYFEYFPFGRVYLAKDGTLRTFAYSGKTEGVPPNYKYSDNGMFMFTSADGGQTFGNPVLVSKNANEGTAIEYQPGKWLVAARAYELPVALRQFRSIDDGQTWTDEGAITEHGEIPGDLLQLADGRLLLAFGDRSGVRNVETGISLKLSNDLGKTWSESIPLIALGGDLGYPSLAQLDDGEVLVAYYATESPDHSGYHAGIARWTPPEVD